MASARRTVTAVVARRGPRERAAASLAGAALALLCLGLPASPPASAQEVLAYPARGQTPAQQQQDMAACRAWAVQQSGFDPSRPPPQAAPPPSAHEAPQGGVFRGAARGALLGTVGGAIAGDTGTGAAIGAATGGLLGGMRRVDQHRRQAYEAEAYRQQQSATLSQQGGLYRRALGACLTGRGYSIS